MWKFLCTQNEFVQVKIVLNFSIQLYWGVGCILQDLKSYKAYYKSRLKGTHDVCLFESLFSKRAKIWNDCRISDCAAAQEEGYGLPFILYNKNVLFVWKYQVSLNLGFWIERSRNFWIFVWSAKSGRGGRVKPYRPKRFVDVP